MSITWSADSKHKEFVLLLDPDSNATEFNVISCGPLQHYYSSIQNTDLNFLCQIWLLGIDSLQLSRTYSKHFLEKLKAAEVIRIVSSWAWLWLGEGDTQTYSQTTLQRKNADKLMYMELYLNASTLHMNSSLDTGVYSEHAFDFFNANSKDTLFLLRHVKKRPKQNLFLKAATYEK